MPGITELVIILLIILVVFGAAKLPGLGEGLGRMVRNFKHAKASKDEIQVIADDHAADLEPPDSVPSLTSKDNSRR